MSEHRGSERIKRKHPFFMFVKIFSVVLFFLIGLGLGVALFVINGLNPVESRSEPVEVVIEPGMHSSEIAALLEEKELIRSKFIFQVYLRFQNEGNRFQAGTYEMTAGSTLDQMIDKLNQGDTVQEPLVKFTIPEGYTLDQLINRLEENGFIDGDSFIELAEHAGPDQLMMPFDVPIPDHPDLIHRLEGYFFPETYEMQEESSELDVLNRMLLELERKVSELPEDWQLRLEQLDKSFHEILTIASIVEREVVLDEERPLVAGVIYNRLEQNRELEIDATVQYALGEQRDILTFDDLEIDHPYNTYENNGLPPGPISNPGLPSIRAALYPKDTTYLFYVTKKDGTKGHLFAETYEEHLENKRKSEQ